MDNKKIFGIGILLLLLVSPVLALDIFSTVLHPFSGIDIASMYQRYYVFLDAVIYLLIFMSLARMVYTKVYNKENFGEASGRGAMGVALGVGLALTFGMVVFEQRIGFNLGDMGPIAAIVFISVIAILLYQLFQGLFGSDAEGKAISAALAYLIIYGLFTVPFGELYNWLENTTPLLAALLSIAAVITFIFLLIKLFGLFGGGKDDGKGGSGGKSGKDDSDDGKGSKDDSDDDTKPPKIPEVNTLTITTPVAAGYANGDQINVAFNVSGPGFRKSYDYDIIINGTSPHGRRSKVSGSHIVDPIRLTMGAAPTRAGTNTLQVNTYTRPLFGRGRIIAQGQVTFPIAAGSTRTPDELRNIINNDYANILANLGNAFQQYANHFNAMIQMHHDFVNHVAGSRDPNAAEWAELSRLRNEMNRISTQSNNVLNAIRTHADYALLNAADIATLNRLIAIHSNVLNTIINYEIVARNAYNTHAVPPAVSRT